MQNKRNMISAGYSPFKGYLLALLFVSSVQFPFATLSAQSTEKNKAAGQNTALSDSEDIIVLNGTQKSKFVTGAVSQISGEVIVDNPIINNALKLAGQLPGLTIFQSNGEPGVEAARTLIRGKRTMRSNTPILMVDGYERDFSFLDPNEIASVTILKDAAATAQYGLRGGNGIISVTTKRGREGKIKINFNASAGIKQATTKPHFLNSYDYARLYNEASFNDYNDGKNDLSLFRYPYSEPVLAKYKQAVDGTLTDETDKYLYPNVNWYDDYIKKSTWQQHYNVNASGGNQYATYYISLGYTNNGGLFNVDKERNTYNTNTDMKLLTLRSNVDIQATKRLHIGLNLSARQEERTNPGANKDYSSRIFSSIYQTPPNAFPVLLPNGMPGGTKDYTNNPYGLLNLQGYSLYYSRNLYSDIQVTHDLDFITKGLKIEGNFAFDGWFDQITERSKTYKGYALNTIKDGETGLLSPIYDNNGEYTYVETGTNTEMGSDGSYPGTLRVFSWKFKLDYERTFAKNYLYAMLGYSQRSMAQEKNTNLPRQYRGINSRISYAYDGKYLAEFNMGYEGSEQMPNSNKYGFFPAFSAGWIISEEAFLKNNGFIDFLKLRASYGISGNDDTGGYFAYLQHFNKGNGTELGTSSTKFDGWEESAIAQDNVTWEKVYKANIGIDAALLNRRLNFSLDLFHEKTTDIMVDPPLPLLMGTKLALMPLGKVENKGLEVMAVWSDRIGKVEYVLTGIYSTSKNKVLDMAELEPRYEYQRRTGLPLGVTFGLEAIRYFTEEDMNNPLIPSQSEFGAVRPGDIMYKDQNNDGVINTYDQVYLGNTDINNQASLSLGLKYKGFDFNIQFVGQWGGTMSLNNETAYEFYKNGGVSAHHLNRYNPQDPESYVDHGMKFYKGDYPRLSLSGTNNRQGSSFWRVSTDLLRLKTIEFGYTFKNKILNKAGVSSLRFYTNGFNLYTWSHSNLIDIESGSGSGMIYPIQKIWNFGVNLSF